MPATLPELQSPRPLGERELRRQIDLAVSRALVDREYATELVSDPTVALDGNGCPPQRYLELRGIRANDVKEFAAQAEALFWPTHRPHPSSQRVALVAAL